MGADLKILRANQVFPGISLSLLHFRSRHHSASIPVSCTGAVFSSYALIINIAALVSAIPTDLRNVPWEDWGPSSTDLFQLATTGPISLGPYWMTDVRTRVLVRQHDLWRTRHTQLMAGDKPSLESRPPKSDSTNVFQHDIKTHLPYRDVMGYKDKDLYNNSGYALVADREWAIGVACKVGGSHVTV